MSRYIDTDRLLEKLMRMIDYCEKDREVNGLTALLQVGDAVMDCPTADVQEVKHGKWEFAPSGMLFCSNCKKGTLAYIGQQYCGTCGAKMDKE